MRKASNNFFQADVVRLASLVLVVFIGGVTFAEISALRYLSVKDIVQCDFLIATTAIVNGSSLLSAFVDEDAVPADIATGGAGG